jgi:aminoglycoside N3'-acetyltransferase
MSTKKAAAKKLPPPPRLPLGVYLSRSRSTAIVFKHSENGVWYLTMGTGSVTVEHCGEERFKRDFPLVLPDYPMLRAVRKYAESFQQRDDQAAKVMRVLMRM